MRCVRDLNIKKRLNCSLLNIKSKEADRLLSTKLIIDPKCPNCRSKFMIVGFYIGFHTEAMSSDDWHCYESSIACSAMWYGTCNRSVFSIDLLSLSARMCVILSSKMYVAV